MDHSIPPSGDLLDGRYRLQELIDVGGTAVVYRATDEHLGRNVAVKLPIPAYAHDPAYLERFREEGRRAAQADHPNIAQVLNVGMDPARPYIVMEFVDGKSVQQLAPLPIADVVAVGRQAAAALSFLHKRNLVHGDVKPANVLVDRAGDVKLVDLGVARRQGTPEGKSIFGSPAYLAPERLDGDPLSPAADIYGLGATLYQALTGRPPFAGQTVQDVIDQVRSADPPSLSRLRPDTLPALERIISRAMSRDAANRFPDMASMGQALARLQTVAGQATGPIQRVLEATQPIPTLVAAPPITTSPAVRPPLRQPGVPQALPRDIPGPPLWPILGLLGLVLCVVLSASLALQGISGLRTRMPSVAVPTGGLQLPGISLPIPTGMPRLPGIGVAVPTGIPSLPGLDIRLPNGVPLFAATTSTPPASGQPQLGSPSTGPVTPPSGQVEMPRVIGMQQKDAEKTLEQAGLRVGRVIKQAVPGLRSEMVVLQSIPAGQAVPPGTSVDLVVAEKAKGKDNGKGNNGNPPGQSEMIPAPTMLPAIVPRVPDGAPPVSEAPPVSAVPVPQLVGLAEAQAYQAAGQYGLSVGRVVRQEVSGVPGGIVVAQSPSPGEQVPRGTALQIVVTTAAAPLLPTSPPVAPTLLPTSAPLPPTRTPVPVVLVPQLVGLSESNARTAAGQAGLAIGRVTRQAIPGARDGTVVSQSIAPGQPVAPGAAIDLVVASSPPPPPPTRTIPTPIPTAPRPTSTPVPTLLPTPIPTLQSPPTAVWTVVVPQVTGLNEQEARRQIEQAGLRAGTVVQQITGDAPAGTVLLQSLAPGQRVAPGTRLDLVVALQPPSPAATPN